MLLTPAQRYLLNLRQKLSSNSYGYMMRDAAYEALKRSTGQDFGFDVKRWEEWYDQNGDQLRHGGRYYRECFRDSNEGLTTKAHE